MILLISVVALAVVVSLAAALKPNQRHNAVALFAITFALHVPVIVGLAVDTFTPIDYRWNFGLVLTCYAFLALVSMCRSNKYVRKYNK